MSTGTVAAESSLVEKLAGKLGIRKSLKTVRGV
jgi:hypothetical protein